MKWFHEWRAWVNFRKQEQEKRLLESVVEMAEEAGFNATPYWAKQVIDHVRYWKPRL